MRGKEQELGRGRPSTWRICMGKARGAGRLPPQGRLNPNIVRGGPRRLSTLHPHPLKRSPLVSPVTFLITPPPPPPTPEPRENVARAFYTWSDPAWISQRLEAVANIAGTVLGLPKAVTALLSGASRGEGVLGLPKAVTALLSGARGVEGVLGLPKAVTALLSGARREGRGARTVKDRHSTSVRCEGG